MKDSIDLYGSKKISQTLVNLYKTKEYTNILVIYNYYISAINQKAVIKQFLPINKDNIISYLESII
jgi:F0F1-type ATP synthase gamma subunit